MKSLRREDRATEQAFGEKMPIHAGCAVQPPSTAITVLAICSAAAEHR